ncbi:MAG TPA: ATP-binding protein [Candidatus Saccharimonadales bacterium]|nr:ATP-binding protein [Candidatus Saccharimonadales bacterium]
MDPFHKMAPAPLLEPALSLSKEPERLGRGPGARRLLVIIAIVGALVSIACFLFVRHAEERRWQAEFERRAGVLATALQRDVEDQLHLLRSIGAFYFSSQEVDRQEFNGFTREAFGRLAGVSSLEWIPRVPAAWRDHHEKAARRSGLPTYQIQDREPRGGWVRAPQRSGYLPIYYAEPASEAGELGRDLATSAADQTAMSLAKVMPYGYASPPFPRLNGTNLAYRCRIFMAVFTNLSPHATVEERLRNCAGYAAVVLDLSRLVAGTIGQMKPDEARGFAWQLLDATGREGVPLRLHQSSTWDPARRSGEIGQTSVSFGVAGRTWVWNSRATAAYSPKPNQVRSWGVLACGGLITALLAAALASAQGRATQVERLVVERTSALDRSNQELRAEIRRREEVEQALNHERELVNALFDNIPDHIYFKDLKSRFLRINASMARRFKLDSPEAAVGRTDFEFFTPEHAQGAFADEQEILRTGDALIGREELETWPDGSTTWVSTTKQCLRDKAGNTLGTFGISRDITLRKHAERRLSIQYLVARVLAESVKFTEAAPQILQELGLYLGWSVGGWWHVDRAAGECRCVATWEAPGRSAPAFVEATRSLTLARGIGLPGRVLAQGEPVWIPDVGPAPNFPRAAVAARDGLRAAFGFPIRSGNGVVGVIEFFSREMEPPDEELLRLLSAVGSQIGQFLERLRMEEELAEKARELERSNRELEQFAYVASHDLQEPLRMISSYTQLLGRRYRDRLDEDGQEFIQFAVDGAGRMQALINDLLAYSRVGSRARTFGPVGCAEIVRRALKNLEVAVQESHARITCGPLPVVQGDPTQLTQLFQNLIGNAIKFRGDRPPVIQVQAVPAEEGPAGAWHFTVRDEGIGIEPQYFERIFVIFQRLHAREEYPGTGIGLAVCKKIVERHGGRIWVESEVGRGSTFHFTLLPGEAGVSN